MTVGRSAAEAVNDYRHGIQRLISCVTDSVVDVAGGYHLSPVPHTLAMNGGQPRTLSGPSRLMLKLQQNYRIVETNPPRQTYRVEIAAYNYAIYDSEIREILIYHWHPHGNSPVVTPPSTLESGGSGRSSRNSGSASSCRGSLSCCLPSTTRRGSRGTAPATGLGYNFDRCKLVVTFAIRTKLKDIFLAGIGSHYSHSPLRGLMIRVYA